MPFNPQQFRRWFLYAAAAIVVVVLGFYSYARWRVQSARHLLAPRLASQVERSTNGFSFSKSEAGRTLFTVHAARAIQLKQGERSELHDVSIVVYGKQANRFDQIYGSDFEYDPQSGDVIARGEVHIDLENNAQGPVRPDQAPPQELKNVVHLKTSGMAFNQKSGIAITKQKLEFRLPQANGSAMGAVFDSKAGILTLQSHVVVNTTGLNPATINAQYAVLTKNPRQAVLDTANVTQKDRSFDTVKMTVFLRDDNTIEHIRASGGAHAEVTTATAEKYNVRSADADFLFAAGNQLRTALLNGGVTLDSSGNQAVHGTAGSTIIEFGEAQRARKIHAAQDVHLTQSHPAGAGKGAHDLELVSDALEVFAAPTGIFDHAVTAGAARIEIQPHPAGDGPVPAKTIVTAKVFNAAFDSRGQMKSLHGEPQARVVSPSPIPGQQDRISTSRMLDAIFNPRVQSSVESMVQQGEVHVTDGQREAFAERARYTPADEMVVLTGSPRMQDPATTTTAITIRLNRQSGDAFADGDVKTTYKESKPQPSGAMLSSGDPVHVTAKSMTASKAAGLAHYSGNARLWQGENVVEAPAIDFQRERRRMAAQGTATTRVKSVFVQTGKDGKQTPVNVSSSKLTYVDDQRRAQFEENVIMSSSDGTMTANRLDVFLVAKNAQATAHATGASQIDHAIAEGDVVLRQPTRTATGQKLVYTATDGKFVLTGNSLAPPDLYDAERGTIRGDSLTFYNRDDRVLVESSGPARAVTQARVK